MKMQVTPICEATNLPLPILPNEPQEARFSFWDYHHHFHPRSDPQLQHIDGKALRYSRGQLLPRALHNEYHRIFEGPPLPESIEEKFRLTVLACAGVVPRQAIALEGNLEYSEVTLGEREFEDISSSRSIYIERAHKSKAQYYTRRAIGRFFAYYALRQDINEVVSERVIDQFLDQSITDERRKELGNFILTEALGVSTEGLELEHQTLANEGYVSRTHQIAPRKLVRKFFTKDNYPQYHDEVARRIASAA